MSAGRPRSSSSLRLLDVSFQLEADWSDGLSLLNRLYTSPEFQTPPASNAIRARFHLHDDPGNGCSVEVDGSCIALVVDGEPESAVSEWVFQRFLRESEGFTLVHAAALAHRGRGALVVGGPHAGKTTLAIALAEQGLEYYSDDVAPLSRVDGTLHSFRRAAGVRLAGGVRQYKLPDRPADTAGSPDQPPPCPLGWVFFLEPRPTGEMLAGDAPPRLELLPADQAALALLQHTMNREPYGRLGASYGEHPHLKAFADLLAALATAHCYRLTAGRPDETTCTLIGLMDGDRQQAFPIPDRRSPAGSRT